MGLGFCRSSSTAVFFSFVGGGVSFVVGFRFLLPTLSPRPRLKALGVGVDENRGKGQPGFCLGGSVLDPAGS